VHDTYLRLAFPREVHESDTRVTLELYLPGVSPPYRTVEFKVKDMLVKGKLEM
jgi:HSP20 family molecular chaperone IbpA